MLFWIVSALIAALSALALAAPLWRTRPGDAATETDVDIYRAQLEEVERDLARGVLDDTEAQRTRTEISRRLLAADKAQASAARLDTSPSRITAIVLGALIVLGGAGLYWTLGAPGYPDVPRAARIESGNAMRAARMGQEEAERAFANQLPPRAEPNEDFAALMAQLREQVMTRANDLQGWILLARNEANLGNYSAAALAQAQVIRLRGSETSVEDLTHLADMMIAATAGYVTPEAEQIVLRILNMDADNIAGRYYAGLLYAQTDRPDLAFRLWRQVIDQGEPENPYVGFARGQIEDAAFLAGEDYTLPTVTLRGPSEADIAGAADMTPEQRQAMIQNMVANLADELATTGGPIEKWVQLINAYGVLGEADSASIVLNEARQVFADDPAAMDMLRAAARNAGVNE